MIVLINIIRYIGKKLSHRVLNDAECKVSNPCEKCPIHFPAKIRLCKINKVIGYTDCACLHAFDRPSITFADRHSQLLFCYEDRERRKFISIHSVSLLSMFTVSDFIARHIKMMPLTHIITFELVMRVSSRNAVYTEGSHILL